MKKLLLGLSALALAACEPASVGGAAAKFESVKEHDIHLREFVQAMPKGGDLHNHLFGAVYAESWLAWAEADGFCIDEAALAIRFPSADGCGALPTAKAALGDQGLRDRMIDKMSLRDFKAYSGWSGHDQFFATFDSLAASGSRFGDMVADSANLAGEQNVLYLELMQTLEMFETILPMVGGMQMSGDAEADYKTLMASEFGQKLPEMVARARADIDIAMARKDELLGCGTDAPKPGCSVEVRFLNQPIRALPSSAVYAHTIFGWHLIKEDERFVGGNLVAPEDGFVALRDYKDHMEQIGYLYETLGAYNVSLHAGELDLGLVHPNDLRFHINDAVHTAHAKRIGHGIDIIYETGYKDLLKHMAENEIMVEINLTSNAEILGVEGKDHPFTVYRNAGVPMALSTDDEGVSRIDLSHEYVRAVQTFDLSYEDLKEMTYNSIKYAFVTDAEKADLKTKLDDNFAAFEAKF